MSEQTPVAFTIPQFATFGERIKGEREERLILAPGIMKFGVGFLDAALGGIFQKDLVLVGAKTGAGKTTLASVIAETNAEQGKRVHYIALEAEDREIERRIKFRVLSDLARRHSTARYHSGRINYLDWYRGALESITGPWEAAADETLTKRYSTLKTYYRMRSFSGGDLERLILSIQDETDLVVLDHLHMVDLDDPSDNRGMKKLVTCLHDVALEIGKPVVVVAHLRKSDSRSKRIIPDLDDFHGSSDIVKICTKAILMAPAYDQENEKPHLWGTYIHAAKCRSEGSRTRFIGLTLFNVHKGRYEDEFELGAFDNSDKFNRLDPEKYPSWAKTE